MNEEPGEPGESLSLAEVAFVLRCGIDRVAGLIEEGELGFVVSSPASEIRVPPEAIDEFVAHHPGLDLLRESSGGDGPVP